MKDDVYRWEVRLKRFKGSPLGQVRLHAKRLLNPSPVSSSLPPPCTSALTRFAIE